MNPPSSLAGPLRSVATVALALAVTLACAAEPTESADAVITAAQENLRLVDNGQADRLWDSAPAFVQQRVAKSTFAGSISNSRHAIGTVVQRAWFEVARVRYESEVGAFPAGQYASVRFSTRTGDNKNVTEMVSLRQEPDGWRLIGYISQPPQ